MAFLLLHNYTDFIMKHEYENAEKQPDYRHFIKGKFGIIG